MPRKPRFYLPGIPVHIVQRGHSRQPVFFKDVDYFAYLDWLKEAAERYRVEIHAYVLMTNHIHLLATPRDEDGVTRMMQYLGRYYVPYINRTYGSSGSLWEGRYKASLIQGEEHLLNCMRYIELNPVRADIVRSSSHYRWSSYRCNGQGKQDSLITQHFLYRALGKNSEEQLQAYKALFLGQEDQDELKEIRAAWQTGTPLGNEFFIAEIEQKLKRKVGQARRGRPSL
ncbi:Transposase and inactivated derivatives [hydrothermal vent metagenome]|uniref:Transposase and inactivated derivatives n=1 Tax=hydrothermal vent metagenome TaxID=652676 RepID=A0A3B0ZL99_9ZZZZ